MEHFGNFSIKKDEKRSRCEEDASGLFKCDSCGECSIPFMICGLCEETKCAICWEHCAEDECGDIHDAFFGDGIKFCATCSHPYPTPLYQVKKEYQPSVSPF
jgi:ribosomal protein L32